MSAMLGLAASIVRGWRFRFALHLLVLPALLVFLVFLAACGSSPGGAAAPDFSGTTLDGKSVSLSLYGGKPLILAFTASW